MTHVTLENLYQEALKHFPYELDFTSCTQGDFEPHQGCIEYSEEYTFTAGKLFDEKIVAGGCIELRRDSGDDAPTITGFFGLSRAGDWENGQLLPETVAVQGSYNLTTKTWELWIDRF